MREVTSNPDDWLLLAAGIPSYKQWLLLSVAKFIATQVMDRWRVLVTKSAG